MDETQRELSEQQWTDLLERAQNYGSTHANFQQAYSQEGHLDEPLNGEWADGMTRAKVLEELGIDDMDAEDAEEVLDAWENGYHERWNYLESDEED